MKLSKLKCGGVEVVVQRQVEEEEEEARIAVKHSPHPPYPQLLLYLSELAVLLARLAVIRPLAPLLLLHLVEAGAVLQIHMEEAVVALNQPAEQGEQILERRVQAMVMLTREGLAIRQPEQIGVAEVVE